MQSVKINRMTLENFKCHRYLNLQFDGHNTAVFGDNATGKTSVYDALTWLLFGKDSAGNGEKNIEVKPLDAAGSVVDHSAITSVEAELMVGYEPIVLKRTYKEVWSTKRGSSKETFSGNTSEYYINGVPYQKNGFDDKIKAIVSEDVFRLLTSVSYFAAGLPWQKRREILFDMAGTLTDRDIMAQNAQFEPLLEALGKLTLDDYKKKLAAERRNFMNAKTEVPARISECQKTIEDIEGLDFAGAKAKVEALAARKESLEAQLLAIEHDSAMDKKRMEIREAQMELTALESENKAYRVSQSAPIMNVRSLANQRNSSQVQVMKKKATIERERSYIADLDARISGFRNRWLKVNEETFTGGACPTCGQTLPATQLQAARNQFEAEKQRRLDDILQDANSYKEAKAQAEDRFSRMVDEVAQVEAEIESLQNQIAAAEAIVVEIQDMDGFTDRKAAIEARISALSKELAAMAENTIAVRGGLTKQIAGIKLDIAEQQRVISKESLLDYSRQRMDQLREEAKAAAECLEAIEQMLFLIDEYARFKTSFVESSINSLFRIARFRLYREQANGGVEDRCDVVYDGVPYMGLNNGMKINVGIDIINALSRHHGVSVPLFVDNAESVTKLENTDTQVIRLVVSESDKELRCVNED